MKKEQEISYEKFHQWLSNCPTEILELMDNIDTINVTFKQPLLNNNGGLI